MSADEGPTFLADPWFVRWFSPREDYVRVRFAILRLLAFVYLVAFLVTSLQFRPLIGEHGLLPAKTFLAEIARVGGAWKWPTIFWLNCSDTAIASVAWLGVGLSALALIGATNAALQAVLWLLYFSIAQIGGKFYSYGWESQLCETGFLAIFLCPLRTIHPARATAPPGAVIVLFRFLIFRIMLGAGLIKIRGDDCWRDLTCLIYHYETQPLPNPLSRALNAAPAWFHKFGVVFNHLVELVAPWFAFGPRRARIVAGVLFIVFQLTLMASGNLSFLNWLTIVPALACFDDRVFGRRAATAPAPSRNHRFAAYVLAVVVGFLAIPPMVNLLSPEQVMNTAYEPFRLVNTYGAFGRVGRERLEVVLQGTADDVLTDATEWRDYELPCKPGDVMRRPCVVSPYHYRLDWQFWFCQFRDFNDEPWLPHLAFRVLHGDPVVRRLFARDPFPNAPPKWVRAETYRYRFTRPGEPTWWTRERVGEYYRPVQRDDPELRAFLAAYSLLRPDE